MREGLSAGTCPVCAGPAKPLDRLDFNKSCEEARGKYLASAGIPVRYDLCEQCGFCFAPELYAWGLQEFATRIYNSDYALVDPDYLDARPRLNAGMLMKTFGDHAESIRHLDYGGGSGLLSNLLLDAGWYSTSYDPFVDLDVRLDDFGKFDLITAFEVFEHVPDPRHLVSVLASLVEEEGIVLFSTLLSDGNIASGQPLKWWYAAPRNGHISLYSRQSLITLGFGQRFNFVSFSPNAHAYWKRVPGWATDVIPSG